MSSTVEVYLRSPGDEAAAVARVAPVLGLQGYFGSGEGFAFTLRSEPWTVPDGIVSVGLSALDPDLHGDGTAVAAYDFVLSMELLNVPARARGELRERAGRAVFDRLVGLEVPLALGEGVDIIADFLPGRGVRDFPPGTSWEEDGRDTWFEPRLHGPRADPPGRARPAGPEQGTVRVYEAGGLIQFVPWSRAGAVAPVASVRAQAGPALLGRVLAESLGGSAPEAPVAAADPWPWVTGIARLAPEEYAREAVSFDVRVEDGVLDAVPHEVRADPGKERLLEGRAIDSLAVRGFGPWEDAAAGELVLGLVGRLRDRVRS